MGNIKNILLTGATGYLGSYLAKSFVDNGYNVSILKRKGSSVSKISSLLNGVKLYDIEEVDYDELFINEKIDAIVHTAASYGRKGETLVELYQANLFFPLQLLENAIKHGVEYFFNSNTTLPANLNSYALSKKQFSDLLKLNSANIKVIDIELQYFYGPHDDTSKFVTFIISKLKSGVSVIDLSPGTQIRDFIYIDDVSTAYLLLIRNVIKLQNYQSVPLGTGNGITLKKLTEEIKCNFSNNDVLLNFGAIPFRDGEVMYSVADISFLNELGWKPDFNIEQGLKQTILIENTLSYDSN